MIEIKGKHGNLTFQTVTDSQLADSSKPRENSFQSVRPPSHVLVKIRYFYHSLVSIQCCVRNRYAECRRVHQCLSP